jgi:hypothetical protein
LGEWRNLEQGCFFVFSLSLSPFLPLFIHAGFFSRLGAFLANPRLVSVVVPQGKKGRRTVVAGQLFLCFLFLVSSLPLAEATREGTATTRVQSPSNLHLPPPIRKRCWLPQSKHILERGRSETRRACPSQMASSHLCCRVPVDGSALQAHPPPSPQIPEPSNAHPRVPISRLPRCLLRPATSAHRRAAPRRPTPSRAAGRSCRRPP